MAVSSVERCDFCHLRYGPWHLMDGNEYRCCAKCKKQLTEAGYTVTKIKVQR